MQACLPALRRTQRRVLVLRSGVGPARRHSRSAVARILDIRVRRVGRLETRGVRVLRQLDRATDCAPGSGPPPAGMGAAGLAGAGPPAGSSPPGGSVNVNVSLGNGHGSSETGGGSLVGPASGGSGSDEGGVAGLTASHPPALIAPSGGGSEGGLDSDTIVIPILIVLALGLAARVTLREISR